MLIYINTTTSIAGIMATLRKTEEPAIASAFKGVRPVARASALKISYHFPIKGRIKDTDNKKN
jgi:hypothetical protein